MSLPSVFYHYFRTPVPYAQTLALQELVHRTQLLQRKNNNSHKDILLLLEHRPVYTAGRRQTEDSVAADRQRLTQLGADFVITPRGGELTYHGPGQIVGYPLIDLSRTTPPMGIRDYICRISKTMEKHLEEDHGLQHAPVSPTGVFLSPTAKIGSIGVQVRHRLTNHGFSSNITRELSPWFDQIVFCGLDGVKAVSIEEATGKAIDVRTQIPGLLDKFGRAFGREIEELDVENEGEIGEAIVALEELAEGMGPSPVLKPI